MTGWLILVDNARDLSNAETPHKVISTRDYVARPQLFGETRPKIINLARSYGYQSRGYYASLLAEARGHRVLPSVEAMLELGGKALYRHALPELDAALTAASWQPEEGKSRIMVFFGHTAAPELKKFGRLLFDWFRCPIMEVQVERRGGRPTITRLRPQSLQKLTTEERQAALTALEQHTRRAWRTPRTRKELRYSLAVLYDPKEELPPSSPDSLHHLARVAERLDFEVEPIQKGDLDRIAEFDALFIRETTSIDNHTYRFARRAMQEGMPVIDDPFSMVRCTNKVFLAELLAANGVPAPRYRIVAQPSELEEAAQVLGYPVVLKVPDGSFSRGVKKADNPEQLQSIGAALFNDSDILLAQEFVPTKFDWRVGVLDRQPLFVCQYLMAPKHWQIIRHQEGGKPVEGNFRSTALRDAPSGVVETAVKAAGLIGDGLYGVDIKETPNGVFVIEINDNPNLDHGIEDKSERDVVWERLIGWFRDRLA